MSSRTKDFTQLKKDADQQVSTLSLKLIKHGFPLCFESYHLVGDSILQLSTSKISISNIQ